MWVCVCVHACPFYYFLRNFTFFLSIFFVVYLFSRVRVSIVFQSFPHVRWLLTPLNTSVYKLCDKGRRFNLPGPRTSVSGSLKAAPSQMAPTRRWGCRAGFQRTREGPGVPVAPGPAPRSRGSLVLTRASSNSKISQFRCLV